MHSKPFWFKMGNRPLKYDVKIKGQIVVIPAGTTNVDIAYGKSYMKYKTADGTYKNMNMYRWNGMIVHGWTN